jgi:hypothetical protein
MALKSKSLDRVRAEIPTQSVAPQPELVRINLNVPKATRARWKMAAVQADKSLSEMIVAAMEAHLSGTSKPGR